jgi:hypothetical protein
MEIFFSTGPQYHHEAFTTKVKFQNDYSTSETTNMTMNAHCCQSHKLMLPMHTSQFVSKTNGGLIYGIY